LDIVEERRKTSSSAVFTFLKSVLAQEIPSPGQTITVTTFSASGGAKPDEYKLTRPANNEFLFDYVNLTN